MEIIITQSTRDKIFRGHDPYEGFQPIGYDAQGWASTHPCFEQSIKELQPKLIIEVGTWKGASAIHMAKTCKKYYDKFEIVCVDTFLASYEHWVKPDLNIVDEGLLKNGRANIYDIFLSNVIQEGLTEYITPLPLDSINAGHVFKHLNIQADLVYIDAGHEYASVLMDLAMYKDIVRPGGHLIGDDWFHPPIKQAAANVFGDSVITIDQYKFLWKRPE